MTYMALKGNFHNRTTTQHGCNLTCVFSPRGLANKCEADDLIAELDGRANDANE